METTIVKSSGSVILEKTSKKPNYCVTSIEKGATVYQYFTEEKAAFKAYLDKSKRFLLRQ